MSASFAAVLSLFSALIVAIIGHVLSQRRSRKDELVGLRLKAYSDFINAASRLVAARRLGRTSDEIEELSTLNDAKARICICADAPVVKALAKFWENGGTLEKESEIIAFTWLCMQIRRSLINKKNDIEVSILSNTLFRLEPSNYSYRSDTMAKQKVKDGVMPAF